MKQEIPKKVLYLRIGFILDLHIDEDNSIKVCLKTECTNNHGTNKTSGIRSNAGCPAIKNSITVVYLSCTTD